MSGTVSLRFKAVPKTTACPKQVQVDIQTSVSGGGVGAAAGGGMSADVVGPLVQGLLFAMGQGGAGFPAAPPNAAAAAAASSGTAQGGRGRGRGGGRGTR